MLGDTKVVSPFCTSYKSQVQVARAAAVAFANTVTEEKYTEIVLGREAIENPPG